MALDVQHKQILTNGVRLHVVQAGPQDAPLVMLLHGFPEFWYGWKHQIPYFAERGFSVWVPDQRGYNLSEKPPEISAYTLDKLAADIVGLIEFSGRKKIYLVGHDWGGNVAWWLALKYPQYLEKVALLNIPHPVVMRRSLQNNPAQARKSWYMFAMQAPGFPELAFSLYGYRLLAFTMSSTARTGTFSAEDWAAYRAAWGYQRSLKSMINWYRALFQKRSHLTPLTNIRVTVPTLLLWGKQDRFLGAEMAQPSIDLCENGQLEFLPQATHWLHHEYPDQVNNLLGDFFGV